MLFPINVILPVTIYSGRSIGGDYGPQLSNIVQDDFS